MRKGLQSFCKKMSKHFQKENMSLLEVCNFKRALPTSCHVSGVICSKLTNAMDDASVFDACSCMRFLQRIVAANNVCECKKGQFHSVSITKRVIPSSDCGNNSQFCCWTVKVQCFFWNYNAFSSIKFCSEHFRKSCIHCNHASHNQLYFVQWYEILTK